MQQPTTQTIKLADKEIIIETGRFAPQSSAAVTVKSGDTVVAAFVTGRKPAGDKDFLPLTIEYREKLYASGMIKTSRFVKREGKPSDEEILNSRLTDRSIRPVFPEDYTGETQIVINPLSYDGVNDAGILGVIAASAAMSLSDIPFNGPLGSLRVGYINGEFFVNPTNEQRKNSSLDMVVSATRDSISMIEAGANEVSEEVLLQAMDFATNHINTLIDAIDQLVKTNGKTKLSYTPLQEPTSLDALVEAKITSPETFVKGWATNEGPTPEDIASEIIEENEELDPIAVNNAVFNFLKKVIRRNIIEKGLRPDGRQTTQIREIVSEVGVLPRTHGSGYFKRGLTHVLTIATLGSPSNELLIENIDGESTKRYMHYYNMLPFASGETGRVGAPGRREIGHGALAERALIPVIPAESEFPYTIHLVSEVLSSNGSTSQASVCGSTLALMDAGVPIKKPVAGIAMGLVTQDDKFVTLSDIAGVEDFTGDMDFKVAGTKDGVTAIQMDVKTLKVTTKVLTPALEQAKQGRLHILGEMLKVIPEPRAELSPYAPRIDSCEIKTEKIGMIIGPGGKTIRELQDRFQVEIDIKEDQEKGTVSITGATTEAVKAAKQTILDMVAEVEVGKTYKGTVKNIMDFGAFVEVLPGQEGLVHVSRMSESFVKNPRDIVKEGQVVDVTVFEVDSQGRINLTMVTDQPTDSRRSQEDRPNRASNPRQQDRFKKFQDHR